MAIPLGKVLSRFLIDKRRGEQAFPALFPTSFSGVAAYQLSAADAPELSRLIAAHSRYCVHMPCACLPDAIKFQPTI